MGKFLAYDPDLALNGSFVDGLYQTYLQDPSQVDASWAEFFQSLGRSAPRVVPVLREPKGEEAPSSPMSEVAEPVAAVKPSQAEAIRSYYRQYGHRHACIDPLGLSQPQPVPVWEGASEQDQREAQTFQAYYAGSIGYEVAHLDKNVWRQWWFQQIEQSYAAPQDPKITFESLAQATFFEVTLQAKFPSVKRFGLEGGEALIAALHLALTYAHRQEMMHVVLGMAHRGRLNVLSHVLNKPYEHIFAELQGRAHLSDPEWWSGDVKYHMGYETIRHHEGHALQVTMLPNPSHLESVNAVILGLARALQDHTDRSKVLPILIHGDASFAGQGVVYETLQMRGLEGYGVGGTLHYIINNQVGFTANPQDYRTGNYCTDMARTPDIPVLHVNGDDVDALLHATSLALKFRQDFGQDVVIDIICYRRNGHNEMDEPMFTQPLLYQAIQKKPSPLEVYREKLRNQRLLAPSELERIAQQVSTMLQKAFEQSTTLQHTPPHPHSPHSPWHTIPYDMPETSPHTGVDLATLKAWGQKACVWPESFQINSKIARQYEARLRMLQGEEPTDWAMGEMLAYASLLSEGHSIRLSGQDAQRGTFSHRHAVLHDQVSGMPYVPLQNLGAPGTFQVWSSLLSEFGVMGFEFGYSLAHPHHLTLWEAQFGDFANGAQVIIDQYLSASQSKWGVLSSLVLLLPHGFEGQGPEHSSARLERFLQLSDHDNWFVVNCTTPANFFHVLRRQVLQASRRPLIVMSPKSLLRHKGATSPLDAYAAGESFQKVLLDPVPQASPVKVQRVVLCSGKIYYDLHEARQKAERWDVALIRVEQLYPFPEHHVISLWEQYPQAQWFWCQEEPQNMGAWRFIENHWYESSAPKVPTLYYVGRAPASSPAVGLTSHHQEEQAQIIQHIFNG